MALIILFVDVSNGKKYLDQPAVDHYISSYFITNPKFTDKVIFFTSPVTQVICGVNQNIYSEVNIDYCKTHGIAIARRAAGGGAVYVDPGNLTYCFVDNDDGHYLDFKYYAQTAIAVLQDLGVDAKMTGRNDLTVDGKKFSGMSALKIGNRFSTGGTLMIDVNLDKAAKALRPPKAKLASKGVKSVHSRVTNLRPYFSPKYQDITFEEIEKRFLLKAFGVDDLKDVPTYKMTEDDWKTVEKEANVKFGDPDWIMGKKTNDMYYHSEHFERIGTVEISFSVSDGIVTNAKIFGDFNKMNGNLTQIQDELKGTPYKEMNLAEAFKQSNIKDNIGDINPKALAKMMIDKKFADKANING